MSRRRCAAIGMMTLAGMIGAVAPIRAQGDANNARFRVGALAIAPAINLTNVGWDSNVFDDSKDNHPKSDVMATLSPAVEGWLRMPRIRFNGRTQADMYYFRELTSLRAVDSDHFGRIDVVLNRVMPWVAGNLAVTRHRQNFEIDAIVKQRNDGVRAGADVRLTKKTSVGFYGGRSRLEFQGDSLFRGTDLARSLNHTGSHEGLALRYEATPLTTFALDVIQSRDRFELSPERNSDSLGIGPSVEFKPLALISGRAAYGFRRVRFRDGGQPAFKGTVASVDLQYAIRGRTQFAIVAQRDLEYSYLYTQRDYVQSGLTALMTQRVGDSWDVRGTVGRNRLTYRTREPGAVAQGLPGETIVSYGINVGYYIGRNRVAFGVQHHDRQSDVADGRAYERLRISSAFTYRF